MDLYLKITAGARKNDMFRIQNSITLGRSKADINLKDSKASSVHAKIIEEDDGLYYLDMNSTNGSLVNDSRINKVKLVPGLVITVGSTQFEILSEFDVKKSSTSNLSEWRESLFGYLKEIKADQTPATIYPFRKCIFVHIQSGLEAGREWILGYGPRTIGPLSTDICILDSQLDGLCLSVVQRNDKVIIEAIGNNSFYVNGIKKDTEVLQSSVDIQIGNTSLEIGFLDEAI